MAKEVNKKISVITSKKPARKPGRSGYVLPDAPKPFSNTNQPSPEAKKAGWAKRNALRDLLNITTGAKFEGSTKDYRELTAKYLGIEEKYVTVKMVMEFRQIEKAILKGDTIAFNAIMDRAFGKPKQETELTGKDGGSLLQPFTDSQLDKLISSLRKK